MVKTKKETKPNKYAKLAKKLAKKISHVAELDYGDLSEGDEVLFLEPDKPEPVVEAVAAEPKPEPVVDDLSPPELTRQTNKPTSPSNDEYAKRISDYELRLEDMQRKYDEQAAYISEQKAEKARKAAEKARKDEIEGLARQYMAAERQKQKRSHISKGALNLLSVLDGV